MYFILEKDKI